MWITCQIVFISIWPHYFFICTDIRIYICIYVWISRALSTIFSFQCREKRMRKRYERILLFNDKLIYIGFYLYGSFYSFFRGIRLFFCEYHDDNNFYHFRICLELISGKMSLAEDVSRVLRVCRIVFGMSFALKSTADSKQWHVSHAINQHQSTANSVSPYAWYTPNIISSTVLLTCLHYGKI